MSHFRSWRHDEDGRIGRVVLFGLIGGVIGVPLGALISSVLWDVVCRVGPPGSLDNRCGLEGLLFYLIGVPVGAVVGIVVGAFVGRRVGSKKSAEV